MDNLNPGTRVRHPKKPEWGIGQVVEVDRDLLRVFFVEAGWKNLNQRFAGLAAVSGAEADHPLLDNLRSASASGDKTYRSFTELVGIFTKEENYPGGFNDERYLAGERKYKVDAHRMMVEQLGEAELGSLIEQQRFDEVGRRAQRMIGKTNIVNRFESIAFGDGLKNPELSAEFARSLFDYLYGDGALEKRFDGYVRNLKRLDAAKWTIVSYHPYLRFPDRFLFVKPEVTQRAAEVCGFEIHYTPELNWRTYESVQAFGEYLFGQLAPLQPRDMIDVQSFMWATPEMIRGTYWSPEEIAAREAFLRGGPTT